MIVARGLFKILESLFAQRHSHLVPALGSILNHQIMQRTQSGGNFVASIGLLHVLRGRTGVSACIVSTLATILLFFFAENVGIFGRGRLIDDSFVSRRTAARLCCFVSGFVCITSLFLSFRVVFLDRIHEF